MSAEERYELMGPLGTGGMAEVLLARRMGPNGFERLLAVKRIRPERSHDPDFARMLLDEARNAASLVHQRIVQVFDIDVRDGVLFYAMEYLHGRTLEDVLDRQPRLELGSAVAIAIALADGLHHAHTRASPIVHRDVAPSNVMLTYDGSVKLIDFGISKAPNNLSNTVFGTFKGRLGYSSPEQCRCEPTDARTDVYSLGLLLYEMATGARAFTAANEQDMLERMTRGQIAAPTSIDPRFPRELEAVLMRALAPDRTRRYTTAREMQLDLEAFARTHALNLSEGALSRLMQDLFSEEVVTWIHARDRGATLEDHVMRQFTRNTGMDLDTRATTFQPPRSNRTSQRPWVLPVVFVLGMGAVAYAITKLLITGP